MKKLLFTLLTAALLTASLFAQPARETADEGDKTYVIGISQLLPHPALDSIAEGIEDYLSTTDLNYRIHLENANGDISTAASIARLFKDEKVDIATGIATPTAQALATALADTPQVFATVTDPDAAGLTGEGNENICGVSDMVPVATHLEIIEEMTGAGSIGMIYTSSEANGIVLMEAMKAACDAAGVNLVTVAVSNSAEVKVAAESIIDRIDAMYVATDNTVISAITAVSDVCLANGIPLFSADTTSSFGTDVLFAGGFDYYKSGLLTGQLIEQVLKGTAPSEIGTQYLDAASLEIYINLDVAEVLGIEIPESILSSATYVIKDGVDINSGN